MQYFGFDRPSFQSKYFGFSPSVSDLVTLFAGGKQGVLYDPSKLSSLWQDAARTIPVTADGAPVGCIEDLSGNGNHAAQTLSASRPVYKTDGILHWLEFDGVDDELVGGLFPVSQNFYIAAAINITARKGVGNPIWATSEGHSAPQTMGIFSRTDVVEDLYSAIRVGDGSAFRASIRGEYTIGTAFVAQGYHDNNLLAVRVNDGAAVSSGAAIGTGASAPMRLGQSEAAPMRFFGGVFTTQAVAEDKKAAAVSYLATKAGVTL